MNLRKNILTALLLAIGLILHQVTPGIIGSMKFDIMLSLMFVALFINKDFKSALVTGLLAGILTAMTTTFPGGQIPNIIDKVITSCVVYVLIRVSSKLPYKQVASGIIAFLGTLVSGSVFLYFALFIAGLPAPFAVLFTSIVVPAAISNTIVTIVLLNAAKLAVRATGSRVQV